MQKQKSPIVLPVPLYHGTSTLFLQGISEKGLGGANPIVEWKVREFAKELYPLVERHLSTVDDHYMVKAATFKRMVDQTSEVFNFQHGDTYLSATLNKAVTYAVDEQYGSEFLTYALIFLRALLERKVEGVASELYRRFPQIFEKLDMSVAPVLIRVDDVPKSWLYSEHGGDAGELIEHLLRTNEESPGDVEVLCQHCNFRLKNPIPARDLSVGLINVARWDSFRSEYVLYPLDLSPTRALTPAKSRALGRDGTESG